MTNTEKFDRLVAEKMEEVKSLMAGGMQVGPAIHKAVGENVSGEKSTLLTALVKHFVESESLGDAIHWDKWD